MEVLKDCPFCGGYAELIYGANGRQVFYVRCNHCEAIGEKFNNNSPKERAITAWNTRVKENAD